MNHIKTLLSATLAGLMISVGGTVYLSCENRYLGAMLFTVGLFTIVIFKLNLFTGKIGYVVTQPREYLGFVSLVWAGNFIGTFAGAFFLRLTRTYTLIVESGRLASAVDGRMNDTPLSIFILAVLCGLLMLIAVDTYNVHGNTLAGIGGLFICVMVFILSGFEHCIANMFFYSLANVWSPETVFQLLLMTAGNAVGAIILPLHRKLSTKN